jgi:hypothetical protein
LVEHVLELLLLLEILELFRRHVLNHELLFYHHQLLRGVLIRGLELLQVLDLFLGQLVGRAFLVLVILFLLLVLLLLLLCVLLSVLAIVDDEVDSFILLILFLLLLLQLLLLSVLHLLLLG